MAILINLCTRKQILLRSSHTFGRHPHNVQTLLTCADTSQIHASIRWNKTQWEIIDHSRNGSILDGKRLPCNTWVKMEIDSLIQFGKKEESVWQVVNLDAPGTFLFCNQLEAEKQTIALTASHHLLPNEDAPVMALRISSTGSWVLDQGEHSCVLKDGDIIELAEQQWEFVCAPDIQATEEIPGTHGGPDLHRIVLHFNVSQDEEHVCLKVAVADQIYDLHERVHHYCLLLLARQRLQDASLDIVEDEKGWIQFEKFSKMLGLDPSHVNIHIFRARHQVFEAIPEASTWPNLVERRRGGVRFGPFKFDVIRGSTI